MPYQQHYLIENFPFSHAYENGLAAVINFLVFTCTSPSEFDRLDDYTSVDANCN